MNLFILRHASAGTRRPNPKLDIKRPLDKDGKQYCLQLAHVLQAMKINFDHIVSSPLKRALQTAALTGTENGYEAAIAVSAALKPEATAQDFQKLVQDVVQDHENVLLVGHSPNIEAFLGSLLVGSGCTSVPKTRLRKGSLARVSLQRGSSQLMWMLDPRIVRALNTPAAKRSRRKAVKPKTAKPTPAKDKPVKLKAQEK